MQCGKRLTAAPSRHGPLPSGRTAEAFRHACVCSAVEEDDLPMIGGQIVTKLLRCVFVCRCGKFSQLYPPALVEKHDFVVLGARLAVLDKEEQTALGQRRASSQIHVRRKPLRHCEARLELERDESRPPVVCTQTTSSLSVPALLRADTNLCPARATSGHAPELPNPVNLWDLMKIPLMLFCGILSSLTIEAGNASGDTPCSCTWTRPCPTRTSMPSVHVGRRGESHFEREAGFSHHVDRDKARASGEITPIGGSIRALHCAYIHTLVGLRIGQRRPVLLFAITAAAFERARTAIGVRGIPQGLRALEWTYRLGLHNLHVAVAVAELHCDRFRRSTLLAALRQGRRRRVLRSITRVTTRSVPTR